MYLVSFDFYWPSKWGSYFCHTLYLFWYSNHMFVVLWVVSHTNILVPNSLKLNLVNLNATKHTYLFWSYDGEKTSRSLIKQFILWLYFLSSSQCLVAGRGVINVEAVIPTVPVILLLYLFYVTFLHPISHFSVLVRLTIKFFQSL